MTDDGQATQTATGADVIAGALATAGCRHVFGMPGGEVLVLLNALQAAGIDFTLCKHENAAGFMAEGSWQATGAPGILLTTIGPGLANGVNSIANAFQEQVPLIVLSGCIGPLNEAELTHQIIDQSALLAPITKAQFQVGPDDAAQVIERALAIARADPPGPVHVDLPVSLADAQTPVWRKPAKAGKPGSPIHGASLDKVLDRLKSAKNPLILAGVGAVLHDAGAAITALSQRHGIPVLTTYKAKGIIPECHPNSLGGHGLSPLSDKVVLPLLRGSDCVLLLGYDPIEMRADWIRPWDAENAFEFSHCPVRHRMHDSAVCLVGDVAAAARALSAGLPEPLGGLWPDGAAATAREQLNAAFAPRPEWGAHAVFATLARELPENGVVTVDSGAHRILLTQMWRSNRAGQLLQSSAFCTMGVALPLAMGYKLASPETPVVAVVGDAGLDMVAGELATARDMGLALAVVVLVDDSLTLIARKQAAMGLPETGVGFGSTDFPVMAHAYGGYGETITDSQQFVRALRAAEQRAGFSVLACEIGKNAYDNAF